jgi:hypothetical protein
MYVALYLHDSCMLDAREVSHALSLGMRHLPVSDTAVQAGAARRFSICMSVSLAQLSSVSDIPPGVTQTA